VDCCLLRTFGKKEGDSETKGKLKKKAQTKREKLNKGRQNLCLQSRAILPYSDPFYPILTHLTELYSFSQPNELMSHYHLLLEFPVGQYPKVFAP
jgi:hypothetical protein